MQVRGHGRLDRVVLAELGTSYLKRARRTVPPESPAFYHAPPLTQSKAYLDSEAAFGYKQARSNGSS